MSRLQAIQSDAVTIATTWPLIPLGSPGCARINRRYWWSGASMILRSPSAAQRPTSEMYPQRKIISSTPDTSRWTKRSMRSPRSFARFSRKNCREAANEGVHPKNGMTP